MIITGGFDSRLILTLLGFTTVASPADSEVAEELEK
jgi:hypothetical protein